MDNKVLDDLVKRTGGDTWPHIKESEGDRLLADLFNSYEGWCYVSDDKKSEDQWDEYDLVLGPKWIAAFEYLTKKGYRNL